jgi:hypothetical protein
MSDNTKSSLVKGIVAFIAFVLTFCLGLFATPIQQYFSAPTLTLNYENRFPYMIGPLHLDACDKKEWAYIVKFVVHNDSWYSVAKNCVPMVHSIAHFDNDGTERPEQYFEPFRLSFLRETESRVDIPPDGDHSIILGFLGNSDFIEKYGKGHSGTANPKDVPFLFPISHGSSSPWIASHLGTGKHRVCIRVYFDNGRAIERLFDISWTGNWTSDHRKMLQEFVIISPTPPPDCFVWGRAPDK